MIKMKQKTQRRILIWSCIFLLLLPILWWQNHNLTVSSYIHQSAELPAAFDGFRIVQISDLHDASFGKDQAELLKATRDAVPDCIFITGDMIESYGIDNAVAYAEGAVKIAPTYYVPGNHEANNPDTYYRLRKALLECGVRVLEDETAVIRRGDASLKLIGLRDPSFYTQGHLSGGVQQVSATLEGLCPAAESTALKPHSREFTLLLSHRPELMDLYAEQGVDLAFAGHTHGGLVRLPWIGAVYGLNQGFLPPYTEGISTKEGTSLVVSRGLGNNVIGQRINNFPELVVVELKRGVPASSMQNG